MGRHRARGADRRVRRRHRSRIVLLKLAKQLLALRRLRDENNGRVEASWRADPLHKVMTLMPGIGFRTCARILADSYRHALRQRRPPGLLHRDVIRNPRRSGHVHSRCTHQPAREQGNANGLCCSLHSAPCTSHRPRFRRRNVAHLAFSVTSTPDRVLGRAQCRRRRSSGCRFRIRVDSASRGGHGAENTRAEGPT